MKTPLLDAIKAASATMQPMYLNSGFRYFPMDTPDEPEIPQTVQEAQKARGQAQTHTPRGPQATTLTATKDNVANYKPKGIS